MSEATAAGATSVVEVLAKDVQGSVVCCPNPRQARWSEHPRVYIDVSHGEGRCPYCGTAYRLAAGETLRGGH